VAGALNHPPARILRQLLVDLGVATFPRGPSEADLAWPAYYGSEPDTPDDVITVKGTADRDQGRTHPDGERQGMYGFQVRVRSSTEQEGDVKAREIAVALDQDLYQEWVTVEGSRYLVHSVTTTGGPVPLGKVSGSRRSVFTLNALASLRMAG
jgi:hypothetical protein